MRAIGYQAPVPLDDPAYLEVLELRAHRHLATGSMIGKLVLEGFPPG